MNSERNNDEVGGLQRRNDFGAAVTIVREELSEDSARILRYSLERQDREDGPPPPTNLGIAMRNLLASRGIVWEEVALYGVWIVILQRALETFLDS